LSPGPQTADIFGRSAKRLQRFYFLGKEIIVTCGCT